MNIDSTSSLWALCAVISVICATAIYILVVRHQKARRGTTDPRPTVKLITLLFVLTTTPISIVGVVAMFRAETMVNDNTAGALVYYAVVIMATIFMIVVTGACVIVRMRHPITVHRKQQRRLKPVERVPQDTRSSSAPCREQA